MRSMWKGSISFGLVMIPVKLYAATEQKDIAFRQVHRTDGGRIRFRRVCSVDGLEVPYEQVAKGYELPSGEMIVLTDEDLADLPLPTTRSIEVLNFVPAEQLDPILLSRPYYIEPESTGSRAYILLRDALERSGKIALAMVALRQRESLATLRAKDGVLVLHTLLWPDEVREPAFAFLDEDIEVRSQELQMAASLIDSMTVEFEPDEYHDHYREALVELVEAKAEGREVLQPEEGPVSEGEPTSLTDALRASLSAAGGTSGGAARGRGASGGKASGGRAKSDGSASDGSASDGSASDGRANGGRASGGRARASRAKSDDTASGAKTTSRGRAAGSSGRAKSGDAKGTGTAKPPARTAAGGAKTSRAKPAAKEAGSAGSSKSRRRAS
jgi:DNA end-binding protein Ku